MKLFLILLVALVSVALLFLVGRGLHVLYSVGSYKAYWEKQIQVTPPENALWYVALGDSTAQGIGASSPGKGYVGLMAADLSKKMNRPVHVINLSITGAKTKDVIEKQLPELKKFNLPADSIITLGIGSNNLRGFNDKDFTDEMDQILTALPEKTVVSDVPYFGGGQRKILEPFAVQAGTIISTLVTKYNMRLAPLHKLTMENDNWRMYGGDFFHPSNYAYRVWQKAFTAALEE